MLRPGRLRRPEAPARRRLRWPLALAGLTLLALVLRLVGVKTGLPYVYNADENNHFVPRAIGMFGHAPNPEYFVNPPAYTYLVAALYAIRWGTNPANIGNAFASDPTQAFVIARALSAVLGAAAVPLTAIAGARLFNDRRIGFVAGALLAVAFLAVHYSHFALNDAPTLAPVALCLVGVAGIYRRGRNRDYALAGIALGLAIATKYTGGIIVTAVVAAAFAAPTRNLGGLVLAGILAGAAFLVADPYALLDIHAFHQGLTTQASTASEEGGKLGAAHISGWRYYAQAGTWAFGWLPSLAALGGAIGLAIKQRRLALILLPAPILLYLYLGHQTRFFARWLLPVYPILALLAAYAAVEFTRRWRARLDRRRRPVVRAGAGVVGPQRRRAGPRRHPPDRPRLARRPRPGGDPDGGRAGVPGPVGGGRRPSQPGHRAPATAGTSGRPHACG